MPIKPVNKKKYNRKCCANCTRSYRTRFDHSTVIRCKQWEDKIVTEGEYCDKFNPIQYTSVPTGD